MSKRIQISVPSPCHENWQQMTPVEKGRFCASCQRKVFDFTTMPDREIMSILQGDDYICGKLTGEQLDKGLTIPKEKSLVGIAASAAAISLLALGANEAIAQEPVRTEQVPVDTTSEMLGKERMIPPKTDLVRGTVRDEQQYPLQYISITDTIAPAQVETDADGRFAIKAKTGDVLEIAGVGFTTQYITVENSNTELAITMKEDGMILGQVIYKRTFFGRIFHWIGNLFR